MSQLLPLLSKLKESGAERVFFAPNEHAYAFDGDAKRPVPGGPIKGAMILEAISELLSNDDIQELSTTRPRIVRHEHDGEDFVLEIVRQGNGIALGIRQAAKSKSIRDSVRREDPRAEARPAMQQSVGKRLSKRMRAQSQRPPAGAEKRTVRTAVDDEGNPVETESVTPVDLAIGKGSNQPRIDPKIRLGEDRLDTKPVKRPIEHIANLVDDALPAREESVQVARDAAREEARDVAREIAERAAREVAREIAEAAARETARSVAQEMLGQMRSSVEPNTPPAVAPSAREPARTGPARIDALLREMLQRKASDLHLSPKTHPVLRVDGEIHFGREHEVLSSNDILEMVREIMTPRARSDFDTTRDADFAYEIPGLARFRVNVFQDRNGTGAVLRQIPIEILSAEKLGLPKACLDMCWLSKGLVLVTGPTGSGKSTTLAAMIDFINKNRSDHIITIEDPVEFVHQNQKCLVNQREIGQHTNSFKNALRAALREDPDIVLVGEMRDLETISIAIETAETGHLVFGTLHTNTAISTVDRIIDQFPSDRQEQIRVMLSESLKGVVAQILCPKIGGGRVAAHEILLGTHAVASMIREGKTFQLTSIMQTSKGQGMVTMNDSLMNLVQKKLVDPKQAYIKAVDKSGFVTMLRAAGIPSPV